MTHCKFFDDRAPGNMILPHDDFSNRRTLDSVKEEIEKELAYDVRLSVFVCAVQY